MNMNMTSDAVQCDAGPILHLPLLRSRRRRCRWTECNSTNGPQMVPTRHFSTIQWITLREKKETVHPNFFFLFPVFPSDLIIHFFPPSNATSSHCVAIFSFPPSTRIDSRILFYSIIVYCFQLPLKLIDICRIRSSIPSLLLFFPSLMCRAALRNPLKIDLALQGGD